MRSITIAAIIVALVAGLPLVWYFFASLAARRSQQAVMQTLRYDETLQEVRRYAYQERMSLGGLPGLPENFLGLRVAKIWRPFSPCSDVYSVKLLFISHDLTRHEALLETVCP